MTAMEKAAWTELLVSVFTVAIVTSLYPWLGNRATAAFGLLGLIVLGAVFLRRRGAAVVVDERDREIANRAGRIGVGSAWMMSLIVLATTSLWSNYQQPACLFHGVNKLADLDAVRHVLRRHGTGRGDRLSEAGECRVNRSRH